MMLFFATWLYKKVNPEADIKNNPEVIIHKGDEIMIDCEAGVIMKNGSVFMENLAIGSSFPSFWWLSNSSGFQRRSGVVHRI